MSLVHGLLVRQSIVVLMPPVATFAGPGRRHGCVAPYRTIDFRGREATLIVCPDPAEQLGVRLCGNALVFIDPCPDVFARPGREFMLRGAVGQPE